MTKFSRYSCSYIVTSEGGLKNSYGVLNMVRSTGMC